MDGTACVGGPGTDEQHVIMMLIMILIMMPVMIVVIILMIINLLIKQSEWRSNAGVWHVWHPLWQFLPTWSSCIWPGLVWNHRCLRYINDQWYIPYMEYIIEKENHLWLVLPTWSSHFWPGLIWNDHDHYFFHWNISLESKIPNTHLTRPSTND